MSAVESTDEKHSRSGSENGDQPGKTGTVNGEKGNSDIENQIAVEQHKEGLSATDDIPDGGLVAWATVTGAWLILFSTFGLAQAYGVYQDYYVRHFLTNYSPSTIGWIGSIQLFWQFFAGIVAGRLFDAGYFYPMMVAASTLYVFAYYMLSLAKEQQFYQVFLSQGFAAGIGMGFLFLPSIGVVAHHFMRKRSLAMGIVVMGSSCGGLVFPIMLNNLIQDKGFPWATRAAAFLMTGCMAVGLLLMRIRVPPRSSMPGNAPPVPSLRELLTDVKYVITIAACFVNILGLFIPIFYLQTFAIVHGINQNLAFYTITIMNGASIFGRVVPNLIGDIWGPFNAIIFCCFACMVLIVAMLGATNPAGVVMIAILYGIFSGAYVSLVSPLFASLANSISEIGIRMGLAFTLVAFSGLIGTPISGALLTNNLIWARPIGFGAACLFVGCILLITARHVTAKERKTWKV